MVTSNTRNIFIFSVALISGILSFLLIITLLWNTNIFIRNNAKKSLLSQTIFCKRTKSKRELQDTYEVLEKENNGTNDIIEKKDIAQEDFPLFSTWIKRVALSSYLLTALSATILLSISIEATMMSTKYVYISYFKEYNFTITIRVNVIENTFQRNFL